MINGQIFCTARSASFLVIWKDPGYIAAAIAGISGLLGVLIGGWIAFFNAKRQRRHERLTQRLAEFYGPLLAMRDEIRAKSELRLNLASIAGEEWPKLVARQQTENPEGVKRIDQERSPEYERLFEYSDRQLTEELLPTYRRMLALFIDKMYLADSSTRLHLGELIRYVEVWNRATNRSLPKEVVQRLDHSEKKLDPFYEDLERHFTTLQRKLEIG